MTERKDLASAATLIKSIVDGVLASDIHEENFEVFYTTTELISQSYYRLEPTLSYAVSAARKYLGDIDIRETDKTYEKYRREELEEYSLELNKIISENAEKA